MNIKELITAKATAKTGQAGQVKFRLFLWLILACVLVFLLWQGIVPSGKINYSRDFEEENESYFLRKLTPEERVSGIENGAQKIIGDPTYFFLRTPRRFEKAKLSITYKFQETKSPIGDLVSLSIIEAGVLIDKDNWRFDIKPIENNILDKLSLAWERLEENGITLLQRSSSASSTKYLSVGEFINNPPALNRIAVYNYDQSFDYLISDYSSSTEELLLDKSLRGSFEIYTYLKEENLDYVFTFFDLNKSMGEDSIHVNLYYQDKIIDSFSLEDDGIVNDDNTKTEEHELKINLASLPEGVYKIEVVASDDIVTKKIKTKQGKIVFKNKLWLYEAGVEDLEILTNSQEIRIQTINPGSVQKILVNNIELDINETYKQFSLKTGTSTSIINLSRDGMILAGDGFFALENDQLFYPEFRKVDNNLDFNNTDIEYIIADYNKPVEVGDWKIAEVDFDLSNALREKGQYKFLISIPGLKSDDDIDDYIVLDEIRVELEGKSLWEKMKEFIK